MLRTCEDGCNGCDECTDWDEPAADDDPDAPPEFGCCLPPGECCMPGLHYLRLTKDGHPGHPLYLPKNLQPVAWVNW